MFNRKYINSIRGPHFPASYVSWSRSVFTCFFACSKNCPIPVSQSSMSCHFCTSPAKTPSCRIKAWSRKKTGRLYLVGSSQFVVNNHPKRLKSLWTTCVSWRIIPGWSIRGLNNHGDRVRPLRIRVVVRPLPNGRTPWRKKNGGWSDHHLRVLGLGWSSK